MRRLMAVVGAVGTLGVSAGTWWVTHSWWKGALAALGCAALAFGKKVWGELEPQWTKRVASRIDDFAISLFDDYRKQYAKHLYYRHRTFDVKGFSTQGKFALELETVYVELSVDPALVGDISQDPIQLPSVAHDKGQADIFAWLQAEPGHHRNFAVVGPPGSGKTTLLKHLALVLAATKGLLKLIPLLLFLRDHAASIAANSEVKLTELIDASLKNLLPPNGWFERHLKKGKCLVMLDGLDEVANPELRRKVVRWAEQQVAVYGANRFLLTSRPNGYRDNPLSGFTALRVLPFSHTQVEHFVRNWYLANELAAHQKDDPGVRMQAEEGANDLLDRLHRTATLQELGVNPLLLTLISTVHRYRSELPGRRVELFAEICNVFLGKRQLARGLELELAPAQKVDVLRVLAYHMMCREAREIAEADATQVITNTLKQVMPNSEPQAFLRVVEDSSGLLVQKENGIYGFAHLTFQEYLASFHIKEEKLAAELAERVNQSWWHETIRLYSAQADASPIVEKCLVSDRPVISALLLATDCEAEALKLRGDLRERLRKITEGAVEDLEPERRRLAAEHMLARRIRDMRRVDDNHYLDTSPVTHAEYQLFSDERRAHSDFRQPDHWSSYEFPKGAGRLPIVGIRQSDAKAFCAWLGTRTRGEWSYSLPEEAALHNYRVNRSRWDGLRFFSEENLFDDPRLSPREILERIQSDIQMPSTTEYWSPSARRRLIIFAWYNFAVALAIDCSDIYFDRSIGRMLDRHRDPAIAIARTLDRDLAIARAINLVSALDRTLDRALALYPHPRAVDLDRNLYRDIDLDLARALAMDLASPPDRDLYPARARDLAHDLELDRNLDRNLYRALTLDLYRAHAVAVDVALARALELALARHRDRAADHAPYIAGFFAMVLNYLCVAEKRAEGTLPTVTGLWLSRARQTATDRKTSTTSAN
jgi:energy-coupling factor transporter ATP-binding protein EcfA2